MSAKLACLFEDGQIAEGEIYEGEAVDTLVMVERDGKTTVTTTVRYASQQVRDAVIASGMSTGVAQSYDVLSELLAKGG